MLWYKCIKTREMYIKYILTIALCANCIISLIAQQQPMFSAPNVSVTRDDHVATISMDYNASAGFGGQLWQVNSINGTDHSGYLVQWWPDQSEVSNIVFQMGCATDDHAGTAVVATSTDPHEMVSVNPICQIQPIANNRLYHVRVYKLNGLGQICSPATTIDFMGGDPTRVNDLRANMMFFDDFNLPMGLPDELKWNNAMTPQTDSRFNLFFINPQCHTHTLAGTRTDNPAGDKAQVAQRARKPIQIEEGVRRKIVFDMDGIYCPRGVWYLDLNPVQTDLTGHMSFFDSDGDVGLPADVFRIKAKGDEVFIHLINSQGALYNVDSGKMSDIGKRYSTNVRMAFDVRLGTDGVTVMVDTDTLINATFNPGDFKAGTYHALWSTIGYNTSKDDNPYFLSHWDNFGFDGPDVDPFIVHNYVTRIDSTDLQVANMAANQNPIFNIQVPDDIRPIVDGVENEVWLVFSYLKNDYNSFNIGPNDYFTFNGTNYALPPAENNSNPLVPGLVTYAGSTISNRVLLGTVTKDQPSFVNIGNNTIQFFAQYTGIVNLHLEVKCPDNQPTPAYTPPKDIHPFSLHGDLPKLGTPVKIVDINNEQVSQVNEQDPTGPTISGVVPIEVLAGNAAWASWGPHLLQMPAYSAELWSVGSTKGINEISLFIRPQDADENLSYLIGHLVTNHDAPSPQIRYEFSFDSRQFANGNYELFANALSPNGVLSHPDYNGTGFRFDASEFSGAYLPVDVTLSNTHYATYTFLGTVDNDWLNANNWDVGAVPPFGFQGDIIIDANCVVPSSYKVHLGQNGTLTVKNPYELRTLQD